MLETILNIDTEIFLFFNGMHNSVFDVIMYWVSKTTPWIPLWLFFIYLIIKQYGKKGIIVVLALVAVVGLADYTSVHAFKNVFERLRPCHNPQLIDMVHIVGNHCGGNYGFVSSHASNMFAIASFMSLAVFSKYPKSSILFFLWASLVGYSRIYLGVHYPGDVIGGAILGSIIAYVVWKIVYRFMIAERDMSTNK